MASLKRVLFCVCVWWVGWWTTVPRPSLLWLCTSGAPSSAQSVDNNAHDYDAHNALITNDYAYDAHDDDPDGQVGSPAFLLCELSNSPRCCALRLNSHAPQHVDDHAVIRPLGATRPVRRSVVPE